ncbi:hypothetical protein [Oligoflexus tunisiensis]|uniref:hypothetical protein n=1 Tax=Oligoflexus tunisiensis TaxID=708132 RepID=UPI00114D3BC1|nr:hypothetical protein [Oligoflexus tunisiensis]
MRSKKIVAGLAIMLLGLGCKESRKQYHAPGDQRIDKSADPSYTQVPDAPTSPAAGLVDGWYTEPTSEEEAKRLTDAIYAAIKPGNGMAGVDTAMERADIENKLGQPDFVVTDNYLRPVAVYGGGTILIFYDRVSKTKVDMFVASNGYLGAVETFNLKVGTDLAPILAAEGGEQEYMRKLYKAFNPGVDDCVKKLLCQSIQGLNLKLFTLTNTLQILFQDDPTKPEKKIFEIRVLQRTPDPGAFRNPWNLDLLSGALSRSDVEGVALNGGVSTWADVRKAGELEALVEPRDFGRNLRNFNVTLENDLGFIFNRSEILNRAGRAPVDADQLSGLYAGHSYEGTVSVAKEVLSYQLCKTEKPANATQEAETIAISGQRLVARGSTDLETEGEPEVSYWAASIVPASKLKEGCVKTALRPDLISTTKHALVELVPVAFKDWLKFEDGNIQTVEITSVNANVTFSALFNPGAQDPLAGTLDLGLGFGKTIFHKAYNALVEAAKANHPHVIEYVTGGVRSLAEKATFYKTFGFYSDDYRTGTEVTVLFSESSKDLHFETGLIKPEFHNYNAALTAMTRSEDGYSINLNAPVIVQGLHVAYGAQIPGSVFEMDPFDRSMRYAMLNFDPESEAVDYGSFGERIAQNLTDGTTVVSRVQDVVVASRGLTIAGKRIAGRSETAQKIAIQSLGLESFPSGMVLTLECGNDKINVAIGQDFDTIYGKVKSCKRFLTPGYGAERVPSELHLAPQGARTHGLTLAFSDELLAGFVVYNVE